MKTPLILIAIVVLALGAFWLFGPSPGPEMTRTRTDLPWQIESRPDGSLHVFDLDIGRSTLREAIAKFGEPEGAAVFQRQDGHLDLEVYFGKVHFGPLVARVVAQLEAADEEKRRLAESAGERDASPTGDWKYPLRGEVIGQLLDRRLLGISYVPGTRGLDRDFFLARFGEPAAWLSEGERAESWFYPEKGLSVLIDPEGPEVLEYRRPADFRIPHMARAWPPAEDQAHPAAQR